MEGSGEVKGEGVVMGGPAADPDPLAPMAEILAIGRQGRLSGDSRARRRKRDFAVRWSPRAQMQRGELGAQLFALAFEHRQAGLGQLGRGGLEMALAGKTVLGQASNLVIGGHALGSEAHLGKRKLVPGEKLLRVIKRGGHGYVMHVFDATREDDFALARVKGAGGKMKSLEARRAKAVDRGAGYGVR